MTLAEPEESEEETFRRLEPFRPKKRSDCADGPRPCPWVGCKYHLYLDISSGGGVRINVPGVEVWEMKNSCALDMTSRQGMTLEEVAGLFSVTRERIRQIEERALHRLDRLARKQAVDLVTDHTLELDKSRHRMG